MKKSALILLALICTPIAFFSLPLKSVAVLTMTLLDQNNKKLTIDISATFLNKENVSITKITEKTRGSWANNLHWWSHSSHKTSNLKPKDTIKTVAVRIEAKNCEPVTLPVTIKRNYEPLSFSLHGGGAAYFHYTFEKTVTLQCS